MWRTASHQTMAEMASSRSLPQHSCVSRALSSLADRVLSFEIDAENGESQKILKDPAGVLNLLPSPAIVAVLFATTDGKFHRVVVNSRLKPESEFYTEFAVEIKNGVLL